MNIIQLKSYHREQKYKLNDIQTTNVNNLINKMIYTNREPEKTEPNKDTQMFENIDQYVFQKRWHKLQVFHQKIKLDEYIQSLNIENKAELSKILHLALDNKEITKSSDIIYDPILCIITNIPKLDKYIDSC